VKLLYFIKMKDEASFSNVSWSDNQLSFTLNSSLKHSHGLSFMVPVNYNGKKVIKIAKNSKDTPLIIRTVKGSDFAFVTVEPGVNYAVLVNYGD